VCITLINDLHDARMCLKFN